MFSQFLAPGSSFTGDSIPVRRMSRSTPNMDLGAMLANQPPAPPVNIRISNRSEVTGVPQPLIIRRPEGSQAIAPPIRIRPALPPRPEISITYYRKALSEKNQI